VNRDLLFPVRESCPIRRDELRRHDQAQVDAIRHRVTLDNLNASPPAQLAQNRSDLEGPRSDQ
jgi:hypothetical protein